MHNRVLVKQIQDTSITSPDWKHQETTCINIPPWNANSTPVAVEAKMPPSESPALRAASHRLNPQIWISCELFSSIPRLHPTASYTQVLTVPAHSCPATAGHRRCSKGWPWQMLPGRATQKLLHGLCWLSKYLDKIRLVCVFLSWWSKRGTQVLRR